MFSYLLHKKQYLWQVSQKLINVEARSWEFLPASEWVRILKNFWYHPKFDWHFTQHHDYYSISRNVKVRRPVSGQSGFWKFAGLLDWTWHPVRALHWDRRNKSDGFMNILALRIYFRNWMLLFKFTAYKNR